MRRHRRVAARSTAIGSGIVAALIVMAACHKGKHGGTGSGGSGGGTDSAWTTYRPTDSAQAFATFVKGLTFPSVTNSPYVDDNGDTVQAAIYPEQGTYLLDPKHVSGLRPSNGIGRVIATITFSDTKYDLPYFHFYHGDPHKKVVYWWLYMPTDDASSWVDYFVSVDDSNNVAPVVQRPFQWNDNDVPYPSPSTPAYAADWYDPHHRPIGTKKLSDGHGWTGCGSGCCN